jgi:hypothetical protein
MVHAKTSEHDGPMYRTLKTPRLFPLWKCRCIFFGGRPCCRPAASIAANNPVRYATRIEEISAGGRPCAECRP